MPHYRCERWLGMCLESLLDQTRPLDAIVVIDDGSPEPPIEIVSRFPSVTLLRSTENVGPYRLIQQVIADTSFDAYMFQDADDWSGPRRLEFLLREAERNGAELVGCQEARFARDMSYAMVHEYPLDVRAAYERARFGYPLMHPSSVVARDLVARIGGFPTGLRFSGDNEFLRRAVHAAHVINIPLVAYFRRRRADSLTAGPDTGVRSAAREKLRLELLEATRERKEAAARGAVVDLSPIAVAPPVRLEHVLGPPLDAARGPEAAWRREDGEPTAADANAPIIILGAPGSGADTVFAALAQHRDLVPVVGAGAVRNGSLGDGARILAIDPSFTFQAAELARSFPDARYVRVTSTVDELMETWLSRRLPPRKALSEEELRELWREHEEAGDRNERAVGARRMARVEWRELTSDPAGTLSRILSFLGLSPDATCMRVFR